MIEDFGYLEDVSFASVGFELRFYEIEIPSTGVVALIVFLGTQTWVLAFLETGECS